MLNALDFPEAVAVPALADIPELRLEKMLAEVVIVGSTSRAALERVVEVQVKELDDCWPNDPETLLLTRSALRIALWSFGCQAVALRAGGRPNLQTVNQSVAALREATIRDLVERGLSQAQVGRALGINKADVSRAAAGHRRR